MASRSKTYQIRPAVEFRQPFRFDFDKPNSRDFVNDEITEYFNYGFNDMTMKGYINKLRLVCKTYQKNTNRNYSQNELNLTRLNDDIPFDFGGFSNFYDLSLIQNKDMLNLTSGSDELMDYFIQNHTIRAKDQMPLLSFVRAMYPSNVEDQDIQGLDGLITQIQHNLDRKYEKIKIREREIKEELKNAAHYRQMNWRQRMRGGREGDNRPFRRDRDRRESPQREESKDRKRKNHSKSRNRDQKRKQRSKSKSRSRKRKDSKEHSKKDHKKRSHRSRSKDKDRDYRSRSRDQRKRKHRH